MNQILPITSKRDEFTLEQSHFERIAILAKSRLGLNIDEAKKPLIRSRFSKRLRTLGLSSFEDYCCILETGNKDEEEYFVTALTTNVTHFYRELHHFDYLESDVLPALLTRAAAGERVRIWSAGCSSGQEPYSIAGSIVSLDKQAHRYDLKILASDVDPTVLSVAQTGEYDPKDCSFPSDVERNRIFLQGQSTVKADLKSMVSFRKLNLMADWPMSGRFDVIMCRNVAIYFDKPTQARLWTRFCEYLKPDGYLFIGHSERIPEPEQYELTLTATTTYRFSSVLGAKTQSNTGAPRDGT